MIETTGPNEEIKVWFGVTKKCGLATAGRYGYYYSPDELEVKKPFAALSIWQCTPGGEIGEEIKNTQLQGAPVTLSFGKIESLDFFIKQLGETRKFLLEQQKEEKP